MRGNPLNRFIFTGERLAKHELTACIAVRGTRLEVEMEESALIRAESRAVQLREHFLSTWAASPRWEYPPQDVLRPGTSRSEAGPTPFRQGQVAGPHIGGWG